MRGSLASRTALLTGSIATAAVLIAGIVAMPLVENAAQAQVQQTLSGQADLVRDIVTNPEDVDHGPGHNDASRELQGIVRYLEAQGVTVLAVIDGQSEPSVLTRAEIELVTTGTDVSSRTCIDESCSFIEARAIATGTGILLVQPLSVADTVSSHALKRIVLALFVGLLLSIVLGWLLARRVSRPLVQAAQAAHSLASGDRDVRLTPVGPTEVADIAEALNFLATALGTSEGRQREFLLSVSHELRTPLTAIRGYAEAMADDVVAAEDLPRIGGIMAAEAQRLDRLVADLLELARTGAVEFPLTINQVDLAAILRDAAYVWADRTKREGVNFKLEIEADEVLVDSDGTRVRQIIDNLAENALRVTPAESVIVFALSADAVLQVRDGGPGLSADDQAVAFAPGELYERYKGVRRVGTGFGLALVGGLAKRLGAKASVGNAPEGGAAFSIAFAKAE